MGYASESVASGHCPSIRRHVTAGVTVASAGILALGLVVAPPDVRDARTEVRQVQLTTFALSPPALLGALEKLIRTRADTVVPVAQVAGSAADIPGAVVKTPTAGALRVRVS
jgi:predicted alpha/beta hydrolase family esterase